MASLSISNLEVLGDLRSWPSNDCYVYRKEKNNLDIATPQRCFFFGNGIQGFSVKVIADGIFRCSRRVLDATNTT